MITRHSRAAIFLHWFNAACWIFLLFTGFAMLAGDMQPIGQWWRDLWHGLLGPRGLLLSHIWVGCAWIAVYFVSMFLFGKSVFLPFLHRILAFSPKNDMIWCYKKALWLTVGPKKSLALGIDPALPPQGFYNAGQKLVAVIAIACSLGLGITGVILAFFSGLGPIQLSESILQWCIFLHFCCAGVMAIFLPVHIYMAAMAPGEGPALRSMFTGCVPEDFVQKHNPIWHEEILRARAARQSGVPE